MLEIGTGTAPPPVALRRMRLAADRFEAGSSNQRHLTSCLPVQSGFVSWKLAAWMIRKRAELE